MNMRLSIFAGLATLAFAAAAQPAGAVTVATGLAAPTALETVACRTVRTKTYRHGRVIYRRKRICNHHPRHWVRHCRVIKKRIIRPNGRVVHKRIRKCR